MDLISLWGKLRALVAAAVVVSLLGPAVADIHVYMFNHLGGDNILYLHCLRNGAELGWQEVPDHWRAQWRFGARYPDKVTCDASLEADGGGDKLSFVAYDIEADSCEDMSWNFTQPGVFSFCKDGWKLRYAWPAHSG